MKSLNDLKDKKSVLQQRKERTKKMKAMSKSKKTEDKAVREAAVFQKDGGKLLNMLLESLYFVRKPAENVADDELWSQFGVVSKP